MTGPVEPSRLACMIEAREKSLNWTRIGKLFGCKPSFAHYHVCRARPDLADLGLKRGGAGASSPGFIAAAEIKRIRPRHVKAQPFTDEWYRQCNDAFVAAMLEAHPELEVRLR